DGAGHAGYGGLRLDRRHQLRALGPAPHHRPQEALRRVDVVVAEPALVAHEVALRLRVVARPEAVDDALVAVAINTAPRRAVGADALFRLEVPDAVLVQEVLAAQRPDRTEVHDIPRQLVVERLAA